MCGIAGGCGATLTATNATAVASGGFFTVRPRVKSFVVASTTFASACTTDARVLPTVEAREQVAARKPTMNALLNLQVKSFFTFWFFSTARFLRVILLLFCAFLSSPNEACGRMVVEEGVIPQTVRLVHAARMKTFCTASNALTRACLGSLSSFGHAEVNGEQATLLDGILLFTIVIISP